MVDMQIIRNRIDAVLVKQSIAEYVQNPKMLEEVKTEKAKIIAWVALHDSIICARFNYLLQQQC